MIRNALDPPDPAQEEEAISLTTFRELGVLPEICDALDRVGITEPFPIQERELPPARVAPTAAPAGGRRPADGRGGAGRPGADHLGGGGLRAAARRPEDRRRRGRR